MQVVVDNLLGDWFKGDMLAVIGILLSAATVISAFWGWTLRAWLTERRLIKEFGADLYLPEDISNATRFYVRPDATSVDLAQEMEEGSNVVATREDLFKAVERFIDEESKYRHLLLLADAGMGKSSFVLNYYNHNRRKLYKRYKLAVIPLGHEKALEKIMEIKKPKDTILFLDAFDEDPEARKDHEKRLDELMKAGSEFRRVLITCRTQFFPKDAAIPKVANWVFAPRAGQAQHTFWHLYLAPFSDSQVNKFLRRRFWFWAIRKKSKARELAKKVPKLTVRPMLLTHIPDLLQEEESVSTTWKIYEILTEKWYVREQGFWKRKEDLKIFSEEIAVQFYLNFLNNGSDRVPREVITNILEGLSVSLKDLDEWKATARSLLHRDAQGNWKFAHRSIMEFLFLKRLFEGDRRCRGVTWTDQMKRLLLEKTFDGLPRFLSLGSLDGVDLSGVDLSGVDLRGRDLNGTNLSGTNLSRTNLRGANLRGANLSGADLRTLNIHEMDLSGANLSGANLSGINLSGINLSGINLMNADLSGVDFRRTNLIKADLRGANFSGANLSDTNLQEANLRGVNLRGMNLSGINLSRADLHGANLSGINLSAVDLRRTDLSDADLSDADLSDADLSTANLSRADLSRANLSRADLGGINLSEANLSGTNLSGVTFLAISELLRAKVDVDTKLPPDLSMGLQSNIKEG